MARGNIPNEGGNSDALIASINALRDEVNVLRTAVDELREELQHLVRNPGENRAAETIERLRVTSLPLHPAADDFQQQVNAVPEETVAELRTAAETAQEKKPGRATSQRGLF